MRTIKELLEVLLENTYRLETGLCELAWRLGDEGEFSIDEYCLLKNYIIENEPNTLFNWFGLSRVGYFWKPGDRKPRIKWLKKHIEKNS